MIIVVIVFSLIYVILLTLILIAYYRDNADLERRVLELEKRRVEKVTQKECECKMACGRKGRPRGSKNIGGRRK